MTRPQGFAKFIIVITTITAAVMELLDTTIVNVALNQISGALGATIEDIAWVITSYAIANVIIIPMTGFLGEYFGRKNYYLGSMILFGIASYFCGMSESLWELVFWRFIQGIGGGALLSTSQAILFDAFEPEDRPMASGFFGMGIILGPSLGPVLGGYLVDNFHWSDIFLVNIPICIIAVVLTVVYIDRKEGEGANRRNMEIDYLGIIFLMVTVGALQFMLEKGEAEGWFDSKLINICAFLFLTGLAAFIYREISVDQPVVNLKIFKNQTFTMSSIFTLVGGFGLFTSVFVYPIMVQRINGLTPTETGLSLMVPTFLGVFLFPMIGRYLSKGGKPLPFMIMGILIYIVFGFVGGESTSDMGRWDFFPMQMLRVIGVSFLQMPLINQAVAGLKPNEYASGISLTNMIRQLGGAFGIAVANNYATTRAAQHRSDLLSNITAENPLFQQRWQGLSQTMAQKTGQLIESGNIAYKQIDLMVTKQAYYLAYLDTFRLVSIIFILIFPFVFLIKTPKKTTVDVAKLAKANEEAH
jgi:DHA2 family multidrug resistance protein